MPKEIREKHLTAEEELRVMLEVAQGEIEWLQQQLAQRDEQEAAIGAGGVSGQRITDDGALEALRACEQAYHRMIVDGTPQDCRAHDAARVAFWRVLGGKS